VVDNGGWLLFGGSCLMLESTEKEREKKQKEEESEKGIKNKGAVSVETHGMKCKW